VFERPRIKLPFGGGLERASGLSELEPGAFRDLRNVQLYDGKAQARQGLDVRSALTLNNDGATAMTDVSFLSAFRANRVGIAVGYYNPTRVVQVFLTAATGLNPLLVDTTGLNSTWGTLVVDAGRPLVFGAEVQKQFVLAHDHPLYTRRLITRYYNPDAAAGSKLANLTANLDNIGTQPIRFRGVCRHLAYLFGWGYGTNSEPDRPEIVRNSKPGEPLVFLPEHYFLAGIRGEPVVRCESLGQVGLLVFKETEFHVIGGYDRQTFTIQPVDSTYGLAGSQLAVVVDGVCYFWSLTGPRATTGGSSKDLGYPLDVEAPAPADLVASGEASEGFAFFNSRRKEVTFVFGKRGYVLHLQNDKPRWSYRSYGIELRCAGTFYTGSGTAIPVGYPDISTSAPLGASSFRVTWVNVDAVGDETVEVWLAQGAGAFTKINEMPVTDPLTAPTQHYDAVGLLAATTYTMAVRYRRATFFTDGYNSTNPLDWPNIPAPLSRISETTDTAPVPPPPGSFVRSADAPVSTESGGKFYTSYGFAWTRTVFDPGSTSEIVATTSATPPLGSAVAGYSGPTATVLTAPDAMGPYLVTSPRSQRWFWLRHRLSDGTKTAPEGCASNPITVNPA
jgi:hypothetical protein